MNGQDGKNQNASGNAPLDLGLSAIIADASAVNGNGAASSENGLSNEGEISLNGKEASGSPEVEIVPAAPIPEKKPLTEYETLAEKSSWADLCQLCEKRFGASSEENVEARLWWIKSQHALASVPVSMLAAPLDSAARHLLADRKAQNGESSSEAKSLESLASELLTAIGGALVENGEGPAALALLEHAYELDGSNSSKLLPIVIGEIARYEGISPVKRDDRINRSIKKLETLRSELEGKRSEGIQKESVVLAPAPALAPSTSSIASASAVQKNSSISNRSIGLLVILVSLIGYVCFDYFFASPDAEIRSVSLIDDMAGPSAMLPVIERSANVVHLDALLYDLDKKGSQVKTNVERIPDAAPVKADENPVAVAKVRDVVDTSGPIEPQEVSLALRERRDDFDKDGHAVNPFGGRASPGSTGRGDGAGLVQRAAREALPQKTYAVVNPTAVLARPALGEPSMDRLEPGDKIVVEARLGKWLLLKSQRGQKGYILAEDAVALDR